MRFPQRNLKVFISDCEGPISKNDNAFEVASHFLPRGDYFFSLISRYDDVQADILKRPRYMAGYTLTLITPFLKAYGVTNRNIEEYSSRNILLIRGAKEMLHRIKNAVPSFIISTSYEQYISSLCALIDFPYENAYCTKLNLDKYFIDRTEINKLKQFEEDILNLPMIEIPNNAKSISQLSESSGETIERLDSIFCEYIPCMAAGRMLEEIKPVGGEEKTNSVRDIIRRIDCNLCDVMYVGDSITDVQALRLVRQARGLTVSFNGNSYAVRNAEVAVLSDNAAVISALAEVFFRSGRKTVQKLVKEWSHHALRRYCPNKTLIQAISFAYPEVLPKVELVTKDSVNRLVEESSNFRKTVRGEAIGRLG